MTDITDRIKEAMGSYEKLKGPFDLRFAKEALADDARTLLPEAIEEIKRLRNLVEEVIEIMEAGPFFPEQEAQVLREKLKGTHNG